MKIPKTTGEMRETLAAIMAGALNGDIKEKEGRLALNAATRITESFQAESRMRNLSIAAGVLPLPMGAQTVGEDKKKPPEAPSAAVSP